MAIVKRQALVPYTAKQMYDLVQDIERYPEFLPWCSGARIDSRDDDCMRASILLAHGAVRKWFTTSNRYLEGKMIEIRLVDGPFSQLEGFWKFHPLGDEGSKVTLDLEFEFSNRLVALAVGPVFNSVASTLVDSFVKRAGAVYGE